MKILKKIRQLMFPKEFRIPPHPIPEKTISQLEKTIKTLIASQPDKLPAAKQSGERKDQKTEHPKFLSDAATYLWRLKSKMTDPENGEPLESMSKAYRHFEALWLALKDAGIDIKDHTNEPYDPGMSLKAVAFQPTPGLNRDMVIETIKPTVYNKNERIQKGEVIVGTKPDNNQ